jgi:hypothetical protein
MMRYVQWDNGGGDPVPVVGLTKVLVVWVNYGGMMAVELDVDDGVTEEINHGRTEECKLCFEFFNEHVARSGTSN